MKLKGPIKIYIKYKDGEQELADIITIPKAMDHRAVEAGLIRFIKENYSFDKSVRIDRKFVRRNCTIVDVGGSVDHLVRENSVTQENVDEWLHRLHEEEDEDSGDSGSQDSDSSTAGE